MPRNYAGNIYTRINAIPLDLAIPAVWRERGYGILKGSEPVARLLLELRGEVKDLPLYDYGQTYWLQGRKAEIRRALYITKLYGESAN